jgi:hypothetical protein
VNIIEAIKSGKRFRRKGQPRYLELFHDIDLCLSAVDIIADDWEVEEAKVTLTKSQFEAAWQKVIFFDSPMVRDLLAKELGL